MDKGIVFWACLVFFMPFIAACMIMIFGGYSGKLEQARYDLTACEALKMELSK
jgi:hypothetical protein